MLLSFQHFKVGVTYILQFKAQEGPVTGFPLENMVTKDKVPF